MSVTRSRKVKRFFFPLLVDPHVHRLEVRVRSAIVVDPFRQSIPEGWYNAKFDPKECVNQSKYRRPNHHDVTSIHDGAHNVRWQGTAHRVLDTPKHHADDDAGTLNVRG